MQYYTTWDSLNQISTHKAKNELQAISLHNKHFQKTARKIVIFASKEQINNKELICNNHSF